jgi:hypothetical protein
MDRYIERRLAEEARRRGRVAQVRQCPRAPHFPSPSKSPTFFKNRRKDVIVVSLSTFEGRNLVRQHFHTKEGQMRPTNKGVAMVVRRCCVSRFKLNEDRMRKLLTFLILLVTIAFGVSSSTARAAFAAPSATFGNCTAEQTTVDDALQLHHAEASSRNRMVMLRVSGASDGFGNSGRRVRR